jgi:hypothetical protein
MVARMCVYKCEEANVEKREMNERLFFNTYCSFALEILEFLLPRRAT